MEEGASKGIRESPAFGIWGRQQMGRNFVYDLYDYRQKRNKNRGTMNGWRVLTHTPELIRHGSGTGSTPFMINMAK